LMEEIGASSGPGITSALLRTIRVRELTESVASRALPLRVTEGGVHSLRAGEHFAEDRRAYLRARRKEEARGRRRLTDDDLRRVAEAYRRALPIEPTAGAVRRDLRLGNEAQARRWIKRARDEGFLGPAPGRRQKGEVT